MASQGINKSLDARIIGSARTLDGDQLSGLGGAFHEADVMRAGVERLQIACPAIQLRTNALLIGEEALQHEQHSLAAQDLRPIPAPLIRGERRGCAQARLDAS